VRPSRLPIVVVLTAAVALLSGAGTGAVAAKPPRTVLTGLQAKVTAIDARTGRMRATILTGGDARTRGYKGRTLIFDVRHARITVADTNGDGRENTLADLRPRDLVGLQVRVPARGRLPRAIPVSTVMDLTALLSTPALPQVPTGPAPGQLPTGS